MQAFGLSLQMGSVKRTTLLPPKSSLFKVFHSPRARIGSVKNISLNLARTRHITITVRRIQHCALRESPFGWPRQPAVRKSSRDSYRPPQLPSREIRAFRRLTAMEETGQQKPSGSEQGPGATRVVEYVRMSTEHQQYSTESATGICRRPRNDHHADIHGCRQKRPSN